MDAVKAWRTGKMKTILETYSLQDIYSCDETSFFGRCYQRGALELSGKIRAVENSLILGLPCWLEVTRMVQT